MINITPKEMLEKVQMFESLIASYEVDRIQYEACGYSVRNIDEMLKKFRAFADYWNKQLEAVEPNWEVITT